MSHPDYLYDDHDDFYDDDMIVEHDPSDMLFAEYLYDEDDYDSYDDSMDGDAESAFGSCGWGVDEYYNTDNDYGDNW